MNHPVLYVSGLFQGSQINMTALTKEACSIYMSIKKSTFYLTGHEITLRNDHLPIKKFLRKMTLNDTVNKWPTEIESFNINFVYISGKEKALADMLSRLFDIDLDLKQQPKLKDRKLGKYCFETFPKARGYTHHQKIGGKDYDMCEIQITYDSEDNLKFSVELPLCDGKFISLQEQDTKIQELQDRVKLGMYNKFHIVRNNVLFKHILGNGHTFEARVILNSLIDVVLHLGHNQSEHNGY